jgi:hypothetical protein
LAAVAIRIKRRKQRTFAPAVIDRLLIDCLLIDRLLIDCLLIDRLLIDCLLSTAVDG